jgi:hypothetical protein
MTSVRKRSEPAAKNLPTSKLRLWGTGQQLNSNMPQQATEKADLAIYQVGTRVFLQGGAGGSVDGGRSSLLDVPVKDEVPQHPVCPGAQREGRVPLEGALDASRVQREDTHLRPFRSTSQHTRIKPYGLCGHRGLGNVMNEWRN